MEASSFLVTEFWDNLLIQENKDNRIRMQQQTLTYCYLSMNEIGLKQGMSGQLSIGCYRSLIKKGIALEDLICCFQEYSQWGRFVLFRIHRNGYCSALDDISACISTAGIG